MTRDIRSKRWDWLVNSFAASRRVRPEWRERAYAMAGLDIDTEWVEPGCHFHSANLH